MTESEHEARLAAGGCRRPHTGPSWRHVYPGGGWWVDYRTQDAADAAQARLGGHVEQPTTTD